MGTYDSVLIGYTEEGVSSQNAPYRAPIIKDEPLKRDKRDWIAVYDLTQGEAFAGKKLDNVSGLYDASVPGNNLAHASAATAGEAASEYTKNIYNIKDFVNDHNEEGFDLRTVTNEVAIVVGAVKVEDGKYLIYEGDKSI